MAFKPGYSAWVGLDNVAGSVQNLSAYSDNFSWPQSVEQLETSTFGTSSKSFIPGLTDGDTVDMSGPLDVTLWSQLVALKAAQSAGSSTATIIYGPGGSVSGQAKAQAECWIANLTPSTGVGGRAEYSAQLQISGAVTNGTW